MNKLDNYIYLTICEYTLNRFKMSNYSTFYNFCIQLKYSVNDDKVNGKILDHMLSIINKLELIYGFKTVESLSYMFDFYSLSPDIITKYQCYIESEKKIYPWLIS